MIYAIISDIHGNLEAFQRVLQEIHSNREVEKIICLGDIVGYGADPEKCIDLTRRYSDIIIAGNHDFAVAEKTDITSFNSIAREAVLWTRKILSPDYITFLKNLPLSSTIDDMHLVHGSLDNPDQWRYLTSIDDAQIDFYLMEKDILFIGHSHIPFIFEEKDEKIRIITDCEVNLSKDARYIINPGSIGQPRDLDPRASFAIYDSSTCRLRIIRMDYDISLAQSKIREAGLPLILAERLSIGK
ncbi:metallophosphoesterase family protein [candidate division WOR-3 bacterium]|nr:metallophosphoesterase family protein [candidate division WOR-3 bacterium]MCK4527141.1 metallophosphoesterase family protein [candidate division WOR-3 bacterium]